MQCNSSLESSAGHFRARGARFCMRLFPYSSIQDIQYIYGGTKKMSHLDPHSLFIARGLPRDSKDATPGIRFTSQDSRRRLSSCRKRAMFLQTVAILPCKLSCSVAILVPSILLHASLHEQLHNHIQIS